PPSPGREARDHRLGAGDGPRRDPVGGALPPRRLVRRQLVAGTRRKDRADDLHAARPARARARRGQAQHRARQTGRPVREVSAEEWDGLELDAYYRRPYVESAALLDRGRPFLLEHEGVFFAGIERDDPRDVVTPYGYGGPTGDGFWDAYEDWARERGVVST